MKTDRELLEAAENDDGAAFRLLASLPSLWTLTMKFGPCAELSVAWGTGPGVVESQAVHDKDRAWAMRRAIVRAAASISKATT